MSEAGLSGRYDEIEPVLTAPLFRPLHDRLITLLRSLPADAWERATTAGTWRVRDVVAHLLDGDVRRIGADRDGHHLTPNRPIGGYTDLVAWLNALNAEWVAAARHISPGLLTDLLEFTGREFTRIAESLDPLGPATFPVAWAGRHSSPMWLDLGREFTERWHHQDQVRAAADAPPLDEPQLLRPVIEVSLFALPPAYDRAERDAGAEHTPGTVVELAVTGGAGGRWRLIRQAEGWRLGRHDSNAPARRSGSAAPACRVTVTDLALARLLLHRLDAARAADQLRVDGAAELARPLLGARAVMV